MSGDLNRVLHAEDCLNVLKDDLALPTDSVDLIYLDPPFNSNSTYNLPFKNKNKSVKPVMAFKDTWTWSEIESKRLKELADGPKTGPIADLVKIVRRLEPPRAKHSLAAYLVNMAVRLMPMRRVLKPTGSIYLHCDPTASHYLKVVMDAIFGHKQFRNEIVWHYTGGGRSKTYFSRKHDIILWYALGSSHIFNIDSVRVPYKETSGYAKGV